MSLTPGSLPRSIYRDSLSVSLTVGAYGIAFGAASVASGFTVAQSCLLSLLTFSGASQFAVIGVLGAGGGVGSAIATASLLGIRNGLYGMRLAPLLKTHGAKRLLAAHLTIDESTAIALAQEKLGEVAIRRGFWLTGAGVFIFWNLFTLAGALGAKAVGDPASWGLDAAVPAAFLGLLWPRLRTAFERSLAVVAAFLALALTPFLPAGLPLIATAGLAALAGAWKYHRSLRDLS